VPQTVKPEKRGWDFFGLLSKAKEPAKAPAPELIPDTEIPVPYDRKGVSEPQPTGDDTNVEYDDTM
jgi:hypothetical protein